VNVLVDTSVWSLALRQAKRVDDAAPRELAELISEGRVVLFRERGIPGSNTNFLICATAMRRKLAIYTRDGDFRQYAKVLKLELHEPRT
jgi:predicted nucleic acid-binding protein